MLSDLKVLYHLALSPIRGKTHTERLESFYGGQAESYDSFRKRLLQGREELYQQLAREASGGVWADLGGGTGSNLECVGEKLKEMEQVYVVDLSPSLLKVAQQRIAQHNWHNVQTLEADVTMLSLPGGRAADVVTFSYSLTMIPDWFTAVDHAWHLLRPSGLIGVVDFHISRKHPSGTLTRHGLFTRTFWPFWFGMDNVHPSPDHLPYLQQRFQTLHCSEHRAKVPYLLGLKTPYYRFIGRKGG